MTPPLPSVIRWRIWLALVFALALTGCTVKLVSDYDAVTDTQVTELQRSLSAFLTDLDGRLGTPEADYANYKSTYSALKTDVSSLSFRVDALPKNKITQEQVKKVSENLDRLEKLHKIGFANDVEAQHLVLLDVAKTFNSQLGSILQFELAKKRGITEGQVP